MQWCVIKYTIANLFHILLQFHTDITSKLLPDLANLKQLKSWDMGILKKANAPFQ